MISPQVSGKMLYNGHYNELHKENYNHVMDEQAGKSNNQRKQNVCTVYLCKRMSIMKGR